MLAHRLRRWPNIDLKLGEYLVFVVIAQLNTFSGSMLGQRLRRCCSIESTSEQNRNVFCNPEHRRSQPSPAAYIYTVTQYKLSRYKFSFTQSIEFLSPLYLK